MGGSISCGTLTTATSILMKSLLLLLVRIILLMQWLIGSVFEPWVELGLLVKQLLELLSSHMNHPLLRWLGLLPSLLMPKLRWLHNAVSDKLIQVIAVREVGTQWLLHFPKDLWPILLLIELRCGVVAYKQLRAHHKLMRVNLAECNRFWALRLPLELLSFLNQIASFAMTEVGDWGEYERVREALDHRLRPVSYVRIFNHLFKFGYFYNVVWLDRRAILDTAIRIKIVSQMASIRVDTLYLVLTRVVFTDLQMLL